MVLKETSKEYFFIAFGSVDFLFDLPHKEFLKHVKCL